MDVADADAVKRLSQRWRKKIPPRLAPFVAVVVAVAWNADGKIESDDGVDGDASAMAHSNSSRNLQEGEDIGLR